MAEPLFLRQYNERAWEALDKNEQQAHLLEVERTVAEAKRTLRKNQPTHVVPLGQGFTYMWDVAP